MHRETALLVAAAILLGAPIASSQEDTEPAQIHGFVSQGYIKTTHNNYLAATARKQGSFDFTEVGLNVTKQLGDRLRVGMQLFSHDLGPLGNYAPQFDWYYLDYHAFDWLGIRAGKLKLPWGLYNESNDIDSGRVAVLLPQSLYSAANRQFFFAQTGGELYGDVALGGAGSLEYRAYGGTMFVNAAEVSAQLKGFEVPYLVGGRLMWRPPIEGLQLGASGQALRFDFDYVPTPAQTMAYDAAGLLPADYNGTVSAKYPVKVWVLSAEYQVQRLLLAAEFGHQSVTYKISLRTPDVKAMSDAYYVMASYQLTRWLAPGLYYSTALPNTQMSSSKRSSYQNDLAATARFDLTPNWLVKLEGHYMHGTAGLTTELNDDKPLDDLTKDWGVFLVKTTAYF